LNKFSIFVGLVISFVLGMFVQSRFLPVLPASTAAKADAMAEATEELCKLTREARALSDLQARVDVAYSFYNESNSFQNTQKLFAILETEIETGKEEVADVLRNGGEYDNQFAVDSALNRANDLSNKIKNYHNQSKQ